MAGECAAVGSSENLTFGIPLKRVVKFGSNLDRGGESGRLEFFTSHTSHIRVRRTYREIKRF